jgi:hypothetical protein
MVMFRHWLESRKAARRLVETDAVDLIARYGDDAYGVARQRFHEEGAEVISEGRSKEHWARVRVEIARRTGPRSEVDTATRYLDKER